MQKIATITCIALALYQAACHAPSQQAAQHHPQAKAQPDSQPDWIVTGTKAMVASDSPFASKIGADVLRNGGNAIDAATAVSFALAVTRPYSTGLGGGGFLIYREAATGKVHVYDYRETAPTAARRDTFATAARSGNYAAAPSRYGYLSVAVPGHVAGHAKIHKQHGSKPWSELLAPAIALARVGFPVDAHYVTSCEKVLKTYEKHPQFKQTSPYVFRTHLREGQLRTVGDPLIQPELADLIERVAIGGKDAFYKGEVADAIVTAMRKNKGLITRRDLFAYTVAVREPIISTYRDYTLITPPPPSSGGICISQTLNILENFDLPGIAKNDRGLALHYFAEALKHAFADRARWLGDADFVSVPVENLLRKDYAAHLARSISASTTERDSQHYGTAKLPFPALPAGQPPAGQPPTGQLPTGQFPAGQLPTGQLPEDHGTSHFSIIDEQGNIVVCTETINMTFGSLAAIDAYGLILNNEMDDFSTQPGRPNAFGLIQSRRNVVQSGKRPLSSMSPTIVMKGDRPFLLIGASGGPKIITSILNVFLNFTDFGMSLEDSITAPRLHHQWMPNRIYFDQAPPAEIARILRSRRHRVSKERKTGIVQAIAVDFYQLSGISDPRKGGNPMVTRYRVRESLNSEWESGYRLHVR